ncbi:MAG: PDR/VanB family oxidoreductase [Sphingomonas sp.]
MRIEGVGMPDPASEPVPMRLTEIRWLASGISRFRFEPLTPAPLPGIAPGAHVGLFLPGGMERQYSLLTCVEDGAYVIGVKRDAAGRGGSRFVHDNLRVGAEIPVALPRNNFPLREDAPHSVFFAGGIGVTPIHAMIERLEALGRPWTLHYCTRTRGEMALHDLFARHPNAHIHIDQEAGGLMPIAALAASAPADAHLYCCGPGPMLRAFEDACAGRDPDTVHVEYFAQKYEQALEGGYAVELARSGVTHVVPPGMTILQVLKDAGVDVTSSCEEGICGACETKVLAGIPDHRDAILTERERAANKSMMICCSGALSDRLVLDL